VLLLLLLLLLLHVHRPIAHREETRQSHTVRSDG
jgi:hypothetical protein